MTAGIFLSWQFWYSEKVSVFLKFVFYIGKEQQVTGNQNVFDHFRKTLNAEVVVPCDFKYLIPIPWPQILSEC